MKILQTLLLALVATTAGYGQALSATTNPSPATISADNYVRGGFMRYEFTRPWNPTQRTTLRLTLANPRLHFADDSAAVAYRDDWVGFEIPADSHRDFLDVVLPQPTSLQGAYNAGSSITIRDIQIDVQGPDGKALAVPGEVIQIMVSAIGDNLTFSNPIQPLLMVVGVKSRRTDAEGAK